MLRITKKIVHLNSLHTNPSME